MKRHLSILLLILFAVSANAQIVNRFRDSTWFKGGVRFDSSLTISKNAGNGKFLKSNASGVATWQTLDAVTQSALDDSIIALRDLLPVGDTMLYTVINTLNTPPVSPNTGDVYLVGNSPTGAWSGHAKDVATYGGSSWSFVDGVQGNFLYNASNGLTYIFRSGNWVQTGGLPIQHNGNTYSGGVTVGTNNASSLQFETNNSKRGRFDSIGRFHVYNLPISTDTFVNVTDINGKFGKVGKQSFLSGISGSQTISRNQDTLRLSGGSYAIIDTVPNTSRLKFVAAEIVESGDSMHLMGVYDLRKDELSFGVFISPENNTFYYGNIFHDIEPNYYLTVNPTVMVYDSVFRTYQVFNDEIVRCYAYCPFTITQTSTDDPSVTYLRYRSDELEDIVWTRTSTGVYQGTLAGAFVNNILPVKQPIYLSNTVAGHLSLHKDSNDVIELKTYNNAGSLSDELLQNVTIELKVLY